MLVKTYGSAVFGISAITITIEVSATKGFKFYLVGLPDNAVKESQQRIETALKSYNYKMPGKKLVINMAPADIRKEGSAYDLPLAIGILAADQQIENSTLEQFIIMGELSLDGTILPIKGALPIALQAKKDGFTGLIVPKENAKEAAVVEGIKTYGVDNLKQVLSIINNEEQYPETCVDTEKEFAQSVINSELDFSDVKGQEKVKRALEIAAAGAHNAIMIGPPGAGKTMLAKRLPGILPPLTLDEALETTKIHSVIGKTNKHSSLITQRPFRAPHHTISDVALVGGGAYPQPGEISLAHNGILFLDELPEFQRTVLEVLRQPLEDRKITISRAKFTVDYPASFMLIASMNPCPCGYFNHPTKACVCNTATRQKYLNKISGPLLDRIDIHIEITPVPFDALANTSASEPSKEIRQRVIKARKIQQDRFKDLPIYANAQMSSKQLKKYVKIDDSGRNILKIATEKLGLSARAYDRILKVARTIADLDSSMEVQIHHLAEAINYRTLDRDGWGM